MPSSAHYEDASDSDEDEEECRVCRGPAEPGRPLFKPCKCSGSIGLTHQDCLTSWLEVTRGDGRCELCSTKFKFAPQYASGTPDRLPSHEVCYRILRRLGAKWLPRALRTLFAAGLWLVVLPLSTSYIYHGWMNKPSAISSRLSWELAKTDTVGGAVIAIIIVVSFLSLMSFAEFLRFQWGGAGAGGQQPQQGQQQQQQRRGVGERRGRNNNGGNNRANNREGGPAGGAPIEGEIDDIIVHHHPDNVEIDPLMPFINHLMAGDEDSVEDDDYGSIDADSDGHGGRLGEENHDANANDMPRPNAVHEGENDEDNGRLPPAIDDEEDQLEAFMRAQEDQEMMDGDDQRRQHHNRNHVRIRPEADDDDGDDDFPDLVPQQPPLQEVNVPNPRPREDARFEPQFEPLRPAFADMDAQDDGPEMEINVALDELLGLRGPLLALIRNLLWLLVFNTAYLGVFAFTPLKFGGSVFRLYAILSRRLPIFFAILPGNLWENFIASMEELDRKSNESNLIYQPSQIAKMGLGYATFSILIFLLQATFALAVRRVERRAVPPNGAIGGGVRDDVPILDGMEGVADQNIPLRENNPFRDDEHPGKRFLGLLECAAAIAKVVILLLIKMLFLPLLLGVWLDWSTLSLFEKTWSDRIEYAGSDLFGSAFLHWVAGITFMLLVTVSVLQLREVAHPDILAGVIRPQEPQPDLLGNLLQESGATHTKRVLLSLGIYAVLLAVHIWIPTRLLMMSNLGQYLPIFRPKFWHVFMPQIQVPVELLIFHLCMLGVLEKYKNNIGEMQHHWLILIGNYLGITDQILPHEVDRFLLVGSLPVFVKDASSSQLENPISGSVEKVPSGEGKNDDIYPLWNILLSETDQTKRTELIRCSICRMEAIDAPRYTDGIMQRNGKKLLSSHAYIRLPSASYTSRLIVKTANDASSNLLPTSIGPYRFRQGVSAGTHRGVKVTIIEVWREVAGKPIPRPPEGWDDLGVGGAERHGRWAWGNEHTSEIENSVAVRTPFFNDPAALRRDKISTLAHLTAKMMILLFISWAAISVVVCAVLNIPLHLGHSAMFLLRIPDNRIHDPLAFAIGISLLVPMVGTVAKLLAASNNGVRGVFSLLQNWVRSFKPHQTHEKVKTLSAFFALWLVVCPAVLGFLYYSFVVGISVKSNDWHDHAYDALVNWGTGTLLLNGWAVMCYFQMFTKRFWAEIVFGDGQGNANENQDPGLVEARQQGVDNPGRNADRRGNNVQEVDAVEPKELIWQGKDGAIARAFESIKLFLLGWEWDKLDKFTLLQDCAYPVLQHLAIAFAVPLTAVTLAAPVLIAAERETGAAREIGATAVFRIYAIVSVVVDKVYSSKRSLNRWFQIAHKVARDDRYLVGEILVNYTPLRESIPT